MNAIIPAAGSATRMRGLPKFLLPCDTKAKTLIERHIDQVISNVEIVWIATKPDYEFLIRGLGYPEEKVRILPMITDNMTQTIQRVLQIDPSECFQLLMPDTYFQGEQPYGLLESQPVMADVACWPIRHDQMGKLGQVKLDGNRITDVEDKNPNCLYDLSWGALAFNRILMGYAQNEDPHIGYAIQRAVRTGARIDGRIIRGKYFDCGTPSEYFQMLNENLINRPSNFLNQNGDSVH